ncbi:uncharacterized protein LOC126870168 isoform X1 [Bombus huntii]|uniref:uncharacterized protein LOC126870168 isoform X1 n=1 Tax=Bombus huntii TaxID=85661 RepID=UPI0021A9E525|nr:uncharacterized protein LOC126870168 isoform X1 [Bombus huntii]XP_050483611.1 uncharacterized protein LOC126870168 isoform X1 [Bombus huntii]
MDIYARPPEPLSDNGDMVQNWQKWRKDFMIFMKASNSINKERDYQAYLLRTYIGKIGQDVIEKIVSNPLKEGDDMNILLAKLDKYFLSTKNEVIERYNFFKSRKNSNVSIENYIVYLKNKAKTCNFGNMTDSIIRDKLIIEFDNKQMRQKLFNIKNLNLSGFISIFNEHKSAMQKRKQDTNQNRKQIDDNNIKIDNVSAKNVTYSDKETSNSNKNTEWVRRQNKKNCRKCNQRHPMQACPAWDLKCEKCYKYNHNTNCCPVQPTDTEKMEHPTAPPLSDIDHMLYPKLDHVKTSQETLNTKEWSWMENGSRISNENLQRSQASSPSSTRQKTMETSNVKGDQIPAVSKDNCRLS